MEKIDITLARQIIQEAGNLALQCQSKSKIATYKSDGTFATNVDVFIGNFITERLKTQYPNHLVLQEEGVDPTIHTSERLGEGYVWVLDPIDGTRGFQDSLPFWDIQLGLLYDGKPIGGIVFYPRFQEMYHADEKGAFCNDESITVSMDYGYKRLSTINVSSTTHQRFDLHSFPGRIFCISPITYPALFVAKGIARCLIIQPGLHLWDLVGIVAIVEKAGGELRYLSGESFQVSDLFHLGKSDRDIIVCPKGDFETVAQYFVPKS